MSAHATILVPAYPAPNRRHYALLTLLLAVITFYGSVAPLHLHRMPFAEAVQRFREVLAQPIAVQSRSDWLANFLLLLPFGFCLMAAICCDRPYFAPPALLVTVVACLVLATFVEFAQLYFPPRCSSVNDIVAQGIGGTTGAVAWLLRGQRLTVNARRLWNNFGARGTVQLLLSTYLFFLLIVQTLPFDFSLSPAELYHKYKEGRVHLLPFAATDATGLELVNKHFWNAALFAPVGVLLAYIPGRASRSGVVVFVLGLLIAAAIESAQLLALSRYFDTADILTGGASVLVSWLIARHCSGSVTKPIFRVALVSTCLAALIFMEWQPFDFTPSLRQALLRLHQVSLVPFLDYLQGNYLNSLDDAIHKMLVFATLGLVLTPSVSPTKAIILFRWSLAVALVIVLEAGQLFLPTRYASVTDVLVGAGSSWIGFVIANRFWKRSQRM
jgi:VanZ family protein